ncbi:MAG: 3'-5' exonuclease [Deltaproteobacteria bacterium HGW-Deltaproteobacteria-23]|jgi:ribonuclease D|nr:MAG: 3'-5' exonuclease [Deltaproteobacteria bacterium HGW-Deltaproteobacteria-23]
MTLIEMITTADQLQRVATLLQSEKIVAFDLEADSMHHYREQVCLLQISTEETNYIVDPLVCTDFSPLVPVFSDPAIVKIFHGADYDVRMLHRGFGIEIVNLFDTMIACQYLGEPAVGLAAVLKKRFSVELDKKYQQADWSKRPLSPEMLDYAAKDTSLLIPLYKELTAELTVKGRLAWVLEECELLSRVRSAERSDEPLSARFKGAAKMKRETHGILEAVLRFRDEEAQKKDLPPFKIMGNETIREIAERNPSSVADFNGISGFSPKLVERYGKAVLQAVKAGRSLPKEALPVFDARKRSERTILQDERLKRLKAWRTAKSDELGIDPGILVNNALLESLSELTPAAPADLTGLKGWHATLFGEELFKLLIE